MSAILGNANVAAALSSLHPVIHVPPESRNCEPVVAHHLSFKEFLLDPRRSQASQAGRSTGYITAPDCSHCHAVLAQNCLLHLNQVLQEDLLSQSSESRGSRASSVTEITKYAAGNWIFHIVGSRPKALSQIAGPLEYFLDEHLLHWIECLSLTDQLGVLDDFSKLEKLMDPDIESRLESPSALLAVIRENLEAIKNSWTEIYRLTVMKLQEHFLDSDLGRGDRGKG
ncbi:hypothetical protein BDV98DRAFT_115538 [Pterulicium gracile]|uniref:Uncharacterized protein n=1 Tax=Pterulicium gracile TaxID=1884261 RepID=A0A5C3QEC8_9AGAR|nr:hypothetical protein BDV98DRAFT_115538 [Pterula gracilis]